MTTRRPRGSRSSHESARIYRPAARRPAPWLAREAARRLHPAPLRYRRGAALYARCLRRPDSGEDNPRMRPAPARARRFADAQPQELLGLGAVLVLRIAESLR